MQKEGFLNNIKIDTSGELGLDTDKMVGYLLSMVRPLQDLYADISQLPHHQRLEVVRFVLSFDEPLQNQHIELQWDQEIRNRIKAFDEGLLETIDYEQVQSELNRRFVG